MEEEIAVERVKEGRAQTHSRLRLFVVGCVMGTVDLIPGVSGGTIALVAHIYDELIASVKAVTNTAVGLALRGRLGEAWRAVPFRFLLPLALGIGVAVFSLAQLLSWLLEAHPELVWAFFFGLVIASAYLVLRRVEARSFPVIAASVAGTIGAYFITGLIPVETPATALLTFLSGAVAITAMILPGISGSFMLVIMGKYQQLIAAFAERDFATLGVFAAGAFVGLALFSRLISYLLREYYAVTVAFLGGFMIGSLRAIWPWKEMLPSGVGRNVLPEALDANVLLALFLAILGAAAIVLLETFLSRRSE